MAAFFTSSHTYSEPHIGDEHLDTVTSQANLASRFKSQDRTPKTIDLLTQGLQISVRKLGKEHPDKLDRYMALREWIEEIHDDKTEVK